MKTFEDLKDLIPVFVQSIKEKREELYWSNQISGGLTPTNKPYHFGYEEDGWCIDVYYIFFNLDDEDECPGAVVEVMANHTDIDEEETYFEDGEIQEFMDIITDRLN